MTGTSVSRNFRAARRRPWPAMIPALVSTRIGLLKPNSSMLAAICATCVSECVLGFRAQGVSFSMSHNSMCFAIARRFAIGSVAIFRFTSAELYLTVAANATRDLETEFPNRCAHAIYSAAVLAWVSLIVDQTPDQP